MSTTEPKLLSERDIAAAELVASGDAETPRPAAMIGSLLGHIATLQQQLAERDERLAKAADFMAGVEMAMPPLYAFGDNEAACWMADRIVELRDKLSPATQGGATT